MITLPGDATPKIVGYMSAAVIFTVVSYEIDPAGRKFSPAKSILGGTIATALLSLLAETGEIGATLGTGLAATAMASAMLIGGAPVWKWISKQFDGSSATSATPAPLTNGASFPQTGGTADAATQAASNRGVGTIHFE